MLLRCIFITTSHQCEKLEKSPVRLQEDLSIVLWCEKRKCCVWFLNYFTIRMRSESPQQKKEKSGVPSISHSLCVCVCEKWLQTHKEQAEQHFFMGPLTAEGPKPQALPRPTLLCNSCPKAIMHGACQTGPALSHHHTLIQALYHIHERSPELYSRLAWVKISVHALIRSAVMTVRLTAGSRCSRCRGGADGLFWGQSA